MVKESEAKSYPYEPTTALHPGKMLIEYLEAYDWSQRELARRTGISSKTISEICSCQAPISITTALRLEPIFDRPAHFWSNLQRNHDETIARSAQQIEKPARSRWANSFPVSDLKKYDLIDSIEDPEEDALLRFFKVSSPKAWEKIWRSKKIYLRKSNLNELSIESVSSWIRTSELAASLIDTSEFDRNRLRAKIPLLRKQSRAPLESSLHSLQQICASAGVAVVGNPLLKRSGIKGCAMWLSATKALVALSTWLGTDDQFWFTFFHEVGHLLMHCKSNVIFLDNATLDLTDNDTDITMRAIENEANQFAMDTLIPSSPLSQFIDSTSVSENDIRSFAEEQDISPGIVLGRLQHERVIPYSEMNHLKVRIEWNHE